MPAFDLTSPKTYLLPAGELQAMLFVTDDKRPVYEAAQADAALAQASEIAKQEGIDEDEALKTVNAGKGVPKGVTPFMKLLHDRLPDGFFPADAKGDTLLIQAYGRILHALADNEDVLNVAAPNVWPNDPERLKAVQNAFGSVLARHRIAKGLEGQMPEQAIPDALARVVAVDGFMAMASKYNQLKGYEAVGEALYTAGKALDDKRNGNGGPAPRNPTNG